MKKIIQVIKKFVSPHGNLFRYSLSFCLLLALLPALTILLKIFQSDFLDTNNLINLLYGYLPKNILDPFVEYVLVQDYKTFFSLIISMAFSIYLASKAFYSFMLIAMSDEGFATYRILVRIKAIIAFVVVLLQLVIVGLVSYFISINKMIIILIGLIGVFYYFFRFLSFEKRPWSYGMVGALFTSGSIVLIGVFFFYIINHYTRYDLVYGPLASLMILLISIYLIANVIYFGYCLNLAYGKSYPTKIYKHERYYNLGNRFLTKIILWFK